MGTGGRLIAPVPRTSGRGAPPRAGDGRRADALSHSMASGPTCAHGNTRDVVPALTSCASCSCSPVPGQARSTTTRPPATSSSAERRSSAPGCAADADVAVGQEDGVPESLARHRVEHVAVHRRDAAGPGQVHGLGHHVDGQDGVAELGQLGAHPARATTDVQGRAPAVAQQQPVGVARGSQPVVDGKRALVRVDPAHGGRVAPQRERRRPR